ncbi:MAG: galactokinase [Flavobacteriaceae bacterium]
MNEELYYRVKRNFNAQFEGKSLMVKSAGRINLIGEHVDYNEGFVFPAAIDKGIIVAIGKNKEPYSKAIALDFEESYEFSLETFSKDANGGWRNYLLGIVSELQKRGLSIGNFNMVFAGDIPAGSGLSSSAALENSIVFSLNELFKLGLSRKEMAKISQKAEHNFVGVNCGIMDQYASMFGKKNNFLFLDCRSLEIAPYYVDLDPYELILINTNVQHKLSDSAYNKRRESCEKTSKKLGKNALRDVSVDELYAIENDISESDFLKALFVVEEIARTQKAVSLIKEKNIEALGQLLFESHEGLKNQYKVSCVELDFLVDLAKEGTAIAGARMMGGGFGGCTINLVQKNKSKEFIVKAEKAYKHKFGVACSVYQVALSNGTQLLN